MTEANTEMQKFSLGDLLTIDMNDVEELRFENLPMMTAVFQITKLAFETIGKDSNPGIVMEAEVVEVQNVLGYDGKPEDLVGKKQREAWVVQPGEKGIDAIRRFKAYAIDLGLIDPDDKAGAKPLPAILESGLGLRFAGKIVHRVNKNDPDGPKFANIQLPQRKKAA